MNRFVSVTHLKATYFAEGSVNKQVRLLGVQCHWFTPKSLKVRLLMHWKSIANFALQMFTERFREVAKAKAKVASE